MGLATFSLHSFRTLMGISSGPLEALGFTSSIAFTTSSTVNTISSSDMVTVGVLNVGYRIPGVTKDGDVLLLQHVGDTFSVLDRFVIFVLQQLDIGVAFKELLGICVEIFDNFHLLLFLVLFAQVHHGFHLAY